MSALAETAAAPIPVAETAAAPIPVIDLRSSAVAAHGPALLGALRTAGCAQVLLPPALARANGAALGLFSDFLRLPEADKARFAIAAGAATNGYHAAGDPRVGPRVGRRRRRAGAERGWRSDRRRRTGTTTRTCRV